MPGLAWLSPDRATSTPRLDRFGSFLTTGGSNRMADAGIEVWSGELSSLEWRRIGPTGLPVRLWNQTSPPFFIEPDTLATISRDPVDRPDSRSIQTRCSGSAGKGSDPLGSGRPMR